MSRIVNSDIFLIVNDCSGIAKRSCSHKKGDEFKECFKKELNRCIEIGRMTRN